MNSNHMRLEEKAAQTLIKHKKTLATAESCTGGLLADRLTNVPGSSAFFLLGVISYDNAAKIKILKIPSILLKKHGAVSQAVAEKMAQNVRKILNTDYGIGITGIAGPSGRTAEKPVGLVFIAVSDKNKTLVKEYRFKGSRLSIKRQASTAALNILLKIPFIFETLSV